MTLAEFLTLAEVWASTAAGAEHHSAPMSQLIFPFLNFLIFAYIIKRFALPSVRSYLKSRREGIVAALSDAAEGKKRAEATIDDYRVRLARLDGEVRMIQESLCSEGEREKTKLVSEGETLAAKIKEDARFLADQELRLARQKIREELASQAETTARELMRRHLSPADQSRLVEDFLRNIGQVR